MGSSGSHKGSWPQAIFSFLLPIAIILGIRWAIFEPFVIPSSSMVPNLLIHDHILVLKSSLGLRVPFTDHWLIDWGEPQRGDVLVFRYPENPDVFYIKRLIGRPGDKVTVANGRISVNGKEWPLEKMESSDRDPGFDYYIEDSGSSRHVVRFYAGSEATNPQDYEVPTGEYFFMGDNRDQSSDGRAWGFVPRKNLLGYAWVIWLSCDETLLSASYMCDFSTLRPDRMFKFIQ